MEDTFFRKEFVPLDNIPSARTALNWYAMFLPMMAIIVVVASRSMMFFLIFSILIAIALVYDFRTRRFVRKIILDAENSILIVEYISSLGKERSMDIHIPTAYYEYKAYVTKGGASWRLLMYNTYLRNQLILRDAKRNGFSKEQLDELDANIRELKPKKH